LSKGAKIYSFRLFVIVQFHERRRRGEREEREERQGREERRGEREE
jgi:hypothetical protein